MSSTWFTSDLHLGHRLVAGLRGFGEDTDAHDEVIIRNWQNMVHENDTVWVLGDLTVNASKEDYALNVIRSLPGTKHFITGNHDRVSPIHRHSWKHMEKFLTAFTSVQAYAKMRMEGETVLLSHFPYSGSGIERHDDKYDQWMLPDLGKWLIHGHTHVQERYNGRQIHVGLDAWDLSPVSLKAISKAIQWEKENR